jgi:FtsZ-binding cell division protein ZapB
MDVVNAKGEGIDLYAMISLAWRSIQQLSAKNDNQQTEIDNLKKENEQLKSQMADILNRLSALENK